MKTDTALPTRKFDVVNEVQKLIVTNEAMNLWFEDQESWRKWASDYHLILKGEIAVNLWKRGRVVWNEWCKSQPKADISFNKIKFGNDIEVSFERFEFPSFGLVEYKFTEFGDGSVDFTGAKFGDGSVDFYGAKFGDGSVAFTGAKFGYGSVAFTCAKFGDGDVYFYGAKFGDGSVDFYGAKFGDGDVYFYGAKFGDGDVYFSCAKFGDGIVFFTGAKFGDGNVDFTCAKFGDGSVHFDNAEFGDGSVFFRHTEFGGGYASFCCVKFGDGPVNFHGAKFGDGVVIFDNATFDGHAGFKDVSIRDGCTSISFRFASFKSSVEFSTREVLPFIPDFVGTKTTNHFVLSGLKCSFKRKWFGGANKQAERLCRLKEIAEHNKDYKSALRFHADEMRAARWNWPSFPGFFSIFHFIKPFGAGVLDWLFSTCSSYGQSIIKPVFCFLLVVSILIAFTMHESNTIEAKNWHPFSSNIVPDACTVDCHRLEGNTHDILCLASTVSLSKAIPFLGGIALDAAEARKELNLSARYGVISSLLSGLSFVFMFLIGLGLRNKFRLR